MGNVLILIFFSCVLSGGLDVRPFMMSQGFTKTAFLSTTRDLNVAIEYSGIKKGMVATVLRPTSASSLGLRRVADLQRVIAMQYRCTS